MAIHTSFIQQLLSIISPHSYTIIPRNNPATTQYPTDFIIMQISNKNSQITSLLNQSPNIKYINIDKILHKRRNLLQSDTNPSNYPGTGGKLFTKFMPFEDDKDNNKKEHDRSILGGHFLITEHLGASTLWKDGYNGAGVNVAIFDTGIDSKHGHFNYIDERTNWTDEDQLNDGIGHGTFVGGIIASKYDQCPGFAPNAIIHTFRVFTNQQMSYTSWFLDAFNYAIYRKMNLLNLSIGGPDWLDMPFVDKVREMQANNVIMITACGNDGKYGTINNPADQLSVIGVGGITQNDQQIAGFQSRGMTTWELPDGYGRVKPDIVTVGQSLYGSSVDGGCRTLSGTSVASPVATGVAALLTSVVPFDIRWDIINPASLKQIFVETADSINGLRLYEQGNGKINLQNAYQYILKYKKHISAVPDKLDFTQCPHLWPFCRQPLYYTSEPYIFNLTLLNPFSVVGEIANTPSFEIDSIVFDDGKHILKDEINKNIEKLKLINIEFEYNAKLWPWCGWLGIYIYAEKSASSMNIVSISGIITVSINVIDPDPHRYNSEDKHWELHKLSIPYSLSIIPTPPRNKRILWDQYHNLQYPLGYLPRDDLEKDNDMLDWFGDHLHTNYHKLYDFLKDRGYFIEILRTDYSCIDPNLYSTLIIVDSEDKFNSDELKKIQYDILNNKLSIIIFGDWYNEIIMDDVRFFDDNTRSLWDALTGGSNIVALNKLLDRFGIEFGDMVGVGDIKLNNGGYSTYFQSGSIIMRSPINSYVLLSKLQQLTKGNKGGSKKKDNNKYIAIPLTIYDTKNMNDGLYINGGRIAVFGDSTCLDANQHKNDCYWLMDMLLHYTCFNEIHSDLKKEIIQITDKNINDIFNIHYLSRMNKPKIIKNVEPLFNKISRVHNMKHVKCPKNIENITDIINDNDIKPNTNNKQLKSGAIIEASIPLINNNNNNKNEYKFVMQPHLYGYKGKGTIHQYDIMLFYPFIILLLFVLIIFIFCRPIQKLFFCHKAIQKIKYYLSIKKSSKQLSSLKIRKIQNNQHYHV